MLDIIEALNNSLGELSIRDNIAKIPIELLEKLYKKIVIRNGKRKAKWKTNREGYKVQFDSNGIPHEKKISSIETINRKLGQKTGKIKRSSVSAKIKAKQKISKDLGTKLKINHRYKGDVLKYAAPSNAKAKEFDVSSMKYSDLDYYTELGESMYRKKMIRDGKVTYKWKTSKPGINKIKYVKGVPQEVKMTADEIKHRKYGGGDRPDPGTSGQSSGKAKRRAKESGRKAKWLKSMEVRRHSGLAHYNKKFPDVNSEHDGSTM